MWQRRFRSRASDIALVVVIVVSLLASAKLMAARLSWPVGIAPPAIRLTPCTSDPNNLPAPPSSPDGRPTNYLHTCGGRIYDSHGREIRIAGVNWAGMEDSGYSPGGLNSRNWQDLLDQIAALGYNTIRLPFSSEAMESGQQIANVNGDLNPDLQGLSWLDLLDRLIAGARRRGLKVILDRHQPTSGGRTNLWYTPQVPEARWIAEWQVLAYRYRGDDTVIGFDLANEPHGEATWGTGDQSTDWRLAAERAGNAVLAANPYLLIFVEGVENSGDHFWWGGNLAGARAAPVELSLPNRVVYSPHDYGPAISDQTWFHDPHFPNNLPGEWDRHWGNLQEDGIAPVVVGEFGGWSFGSDSDGAWQRALLAYLQLHRIGAIVWSLNPSWDTGGVLNSDWQTANAAKADAYRPILAPLLDPVDATLSNPQTTRPVVLARPIENDGSADQVAFSFRILNDGPAPLDLSRLEARYWLKAGPADPSTQSIQVDAGAISGTTVQARLVDVSRGGQDHYIQIRFGQGAAPIPRYRATGAVNVRFQKPTGLGLPATSDYSFVAGPAHTDLYRESSQVTLYFDGHLVWGQEP